HARRAANNQHPWQHALRDVRSEQRPDRGSVIEGPRRQAAGLIHTHGEQESRDAFTPRRQRRRPPDTSAFAGFSRLLLPWDDRRYNTTMPLRNIGSLLPYHTHVDPAIVVSSLNQMIDDARSVEGFHEVYTNAEKQPEPSRKNTGLFFFKG